MIVAWLVSLATAGAAAAIIGLWIRRSQEQAARVVATTSQGVRIEPGPIVPWPIEHTKLIDNTLEAAIGFWVKRYPARGVDIRSTFIGATIEFQREPLIQPGTHAVAHGLTVDRRMHIAWLPGDTLVIALSLVRHEAGHLALFAAGITGADANDRHHEIMQREDYGA